MVEHVPGNRPAGWFSRRHQTNGPLEEYRVAKAARLAKQAADIKRRADARAKRTNAEQIARLDALLGKGVGAKRERARLAKAK